MPKKEKSLREKYSKMSSKQLNTELRLEMQKFGRGSPEFLERYAVINDLLSKK